MVGWPVVGPMLSVASLQSLESRLVFPEPVRPMQTTSYSGLGGGGPLQHNVLKHWRQDGERQVEGYDDFHSNSPLQFAFWQTFGSMCVASETEPHLEAIWHLLTPSGRAKVSARKKTSLPHSASIGIIWAESYRTVLGRARTQYISCRNMSMFSVSYCRRALVDVMTINEWKKAGQ